MKYMMLLARSDADWEALGDAGRDKETINQWWAEHAREGHIVGGQELHPICIRLTLRGRAQGAIDRYWAWFCGG